MDLLDYRYNGEEPFQIHSAQTCSGNIEEKNQAKRDIKQNIKMISEQVDRLFALKKEGILVIFQAMDAGGKDSIVKHVFAGLNPLAVTVTSFKEPSKEERQHDYLWRIVPHLPAYGMISVFNRSYYEDVLISKIHRLYDNLPQRCLDGDVIADRYRQICALERYLWENGIRVVKIFLNISKEEQKRRFLKRISKESKNWKFAESDLTERNFWQEYQTAYEDAINATASEKAPWYVIPADHKWYAKWVVSEILKDILAEISPQYPPVTSQQRKVLDKCREQLEREP